MRTPTTAVAVLVATAVEVGGLVDTRAFITLTSSRPTAAPDRRPRVEHQYRRRRNSSTSLLPPRAVQQYGDSRDEDDQQIFWDAVVEVSRMTVPKVSAQCSCYCAVRCCSLIWGLVSRPNPPGVQHDALGLERCSPNGGLQQQ